MPVLPRVMPRYRGPLFSMDDVVCAGSEAGGGPEEASPRPEIVFVRRGLFVRHDRRGRVTADPNQVLFFNAGEPYSVSHPAGAGDACTALSFFPEALAPPAAGSEAPSPSRPFLLSHAAAGPGLLLHLQRLRAAVGARVLDTLEIEDLALSLLEGLRPGPGTAGGPQEGEPGRDGLPRRRSSRKALLDRVEACRWILTQRLGEPLSLADLGREVGVSPFHLHRAFRAVTGQPVHRYRTRLRLGAALDRVAGGEKDLTGLALELGFSGHSHLTTSFRRAFGLPPSALRAQLRGRARRSLAGANRKNVKA